MVELPPERPAEREPWTATQAVAFLDGIVGDEIAELIEVLVGTGLRRGEALVLRWRYVDLDRRILRIDPSRGHLSDVGTCRTSAGTSCSPARRPRAPPRDQGLRRG
jgi:integrase